MTDGDYDSAHCNGVIAQDSISVSGNTADHIGYNADRRRLLGSSNVARHRDQCTWSGRLHCRVRLANNQSAQDLMANCATDSSHADLAATGGGRHRVNEDRAEVE